MTEIAVFPPDFPTGEPPAEGDWHGLWSGIHVSLGKIARNLPDPRSERRRKSNSVWSIRVDPVPIALTAGAGVLDLPQFFSPSLGEFWDVHTISATGFTAGTVQAWINMPTISSAALQGALRVPFPAAGVNNFGKNQLHLRPQDRLVFVAAGITGSVLVSMDATRVSEEYWADYLL